MATQSVDFSMSQLSLSSNGSQNEDWDRSDNDVQPHDIPDFPKTTPRNSVVFPGGQIQETPGKTTFTREKRSLSELLRIHAEKGTECEFSPEEASRVGEVLGQWINSALSPYESEDEFFSGAHDDSWLPSKRTIPTDQNGRPRGQSESKVESRSSTTTSRA